MTSCFEATYPMASITYIDKNLPLKIIAEVFSPFIALDELNSGLPATIYSFKIKIILRHLCMYTLQDGFENKAGIHTSGQNEARVNTANSLPGKTEVLCTIESKIGDDQLWSQRDYGSMSVAALNKNSFAPDIHKSSA